MPLTALIVDRVSHAGRQTSNDIIETPVSASDVQCPPLGGMNFGKPRPMTIEEVKELPGRFAFAAKTLYDAGADGIQLHAAVRSLRPFRTLLTVYLARLSHLSIPQSSR